MVYSLIPPERADITRAATAGLIAPDGVRRPDTSLDPWVDDVTPDDIFALYRDMVLTRRVDAEGFALQRQGQLGLWAPCQGQEAAQIGTARGIEHSDFVFPTYRELGVVRTRGASIADVVSLWRGERNSTYDPFEINTATMQIIIGAQTLHAVGYAMGIQRDGTDDVAVAYFGDGASSQGDVNEAMVFAASFAAPVVFVCQNNQWAISEPVGVQAVAPIAGRAPGFGIPSVRVDGNDVLACLAAMRWAAEHARSGGGPAFIEAVTYRMGPHTTSDDPKRYRDEAELAAWADRDPIVRIERHLKAIGAWSDADAARLDSEADALGAEVRETCLALPRRASMEVFDHVYAEPHAGLERERAAHAAFLASMGEEDAR